jgi:hypothetical protein
MQTRPPTFTAFNGRAFQYRDEPIESPDRHEAGWGTLRG